MNQTAEPIASVSWRDYLELCKPRVVVLMLICAAVGSLLAVPGLPPMDVVLWHLLGMAMVGSSAAVINHCADAHIDSRMARTDGRPVATGRLPLSRALMFSAALVIVGTVILVTYVNVLTAWLNLASWAGYGLVYTLYLKRATPQNIVIGGIFGAAPPLFGWTAVTNSIEPGALLLVLIIFVWTPPHFWALALDRREDYARVDIPMLPVTHGEAFTRLQILLYTVLLIAATLMPVAIGMSHGIYLVSALALDAGFMYWAITLYRNQKPSAAIETFKFSIPYLAFLFLALLVDHYIIIPLASVSPLSPTPQALPPIEVIPMQASHWLQATHALI